MGTTKLVTQTLFFPAIGEKQGVTKHRPAGFSQSLMTLKLCYDSQQPAHKLESCTQQHEKDTEVTAALELNQAASSTRETVPALIHDYVVIDSSRQALKNPLNGSLLPAIHCVSGEKVTLQHFKSSTQTAAEFCADYSRFSHRHLHKFYDTLQSEKGGSWLVTDYTQHKSLLNLYQLGYRFCQVDIKEIIRQVISAVECLHRNSYSHCRLDLENLKILGNRVDRVMVSVSGLEYCRDITEGRHKKDKSTDISGVGYILLSLLSGEHITAHTAKRKINTVFDSVLEKDLNKDCSNLLNRFFNAKKGMELSLPELIHNPWLNKGVNISLEGYIQQCHTNLKKTLPNFTVVRHMSILTDTSQDQIFSDILSQKPTKTYAMYTFLLRCWRAGNTLPDSLEVNNARIDELLSNENKSTDVVAEDALLAQKVFRLPKLNPIGVGCSKAQTDQKPDRMTFRGMLKLLTQQNRPLHLEARSKSFPKSNEVSDRKASISTGVLAAALSRENPTGQQRNGVNVEKMTRREKLRFYKAKQEMGRLLKTPPFLSAPPNSAHIRSRRISILIMNMTEQDSPAEESSSPNPPNQPILFQGEANQAEDQSMEADGKQQKISLELEEKITAEKDLLVVSDDAEEICSRKKSEVKSVHFLEPCKKAYVIEKKSPTLSIQNHPEIRCSKPIAKAAPELKGFRYIQHERRQQLHASKTKSDQTLSVDMSKLVAKWKSVQRKP